MKVDQCKIGVKFRYDGFNFKSHRTHIQEILFLESESMIVRPIPGSITERRIFFDQKYIEFCNIVSDASKGTKEERSK